MKAQGNGHLINTVSMAGIISLKGSATYSATKFGLRGSSAEMKPLGVDVSGIYLSAIDTPMLRHEATHPKGSSLNFLTQPEQLETVAKLVLRAIQTKKLEYYLPFGDSISSKFFSVFPSLISKVYPILEKIGEKGRIQFLKKNGLSL